MKPGNKHRDVATLSSPLSPRKRAGVRVPFSDRTIHFNPNAGACREKILGMPPDWRQSIILLGPSPSQRTRAARNGHTNPTPTANHFALRCPQCHARIRKLFLPLCREQEAIDAHMAQCWLHTYSSHIRPHMTTLCALRSAIIDRYGALFTPRSLACRTCLGLCYGEVKRQHRAPAAR